MRATPLLCAAMLLSSTAFAAEGLSGRLLTRGPATAGAEIEVQVEISWTGRPELAAPGVPDITVYVVLVAGFLAAILFIALVLAGILSQGSPGPSGSASGETSDPAPVAPSGPATGGSGGGATSRQGSGSSPSQPRTSPPSPDDRVASGSSQDSQRSGGGGSGEDRGSSHSGAADGDAYSSPRSRTPAHPKSRLPGEQSGAP